MPRETTDPLRDAQPPSATVAAGSTVRNRHTGKEEKVIEVDGFARRYRLSGDGNGPAKVVGWAPEGLDEHWEHVA